MNLETSSWVDRLKSSQLTLLPCPDPMKIETKGILNSKRGKNIQFFQAAEYMT